MFCETHLPNFSLLVNADSFLLALPDFLQNTFKASIDSGL